MLKITLNNLPKLLAALNELGELQVPCENKSGKVDFEKWNAEKRPRFDITLTSKSAKDLFFPQVEDLLAFKTKGKNLSIEQIMPSDKKVILMGVRACDIKSFELLDKVFLKDPVDTYYKARRENTLIIGTACSEPEETCFCGSFGIDATAPCGDVTTWIAEDVLYWQANSEAGKALTEKVADLLEEAEASKVEEQAAVTKAVLEQMPLANFKVAGKIPQDELKTFNSKVWEEISAGCLSCCTCTYVCPTCHCYDIRDYAVSDNHTERYRCWDSCLASDFTKMAHGNPRKTKVERFRQRYMHKLVYFPNNNEGDFACVGCGRCLQKCPVNLNIVKVAKALEVSEDV